METIQRSISTAEELSVATTNLAEASCSVRLSDKDAAEVLASAENPPVPNEAARQAAARFMQIHG